MERCGWEGRRGVDWKGWKLMGGVWIGGCGDGTGGGCVTWEGYGWEEHCIYPSPPQVWHLPDEGRGPMDASAALPLRCTHSSPSAAFEGQPLEVVTPHIQGNMTHIHTSSIHPYKNVHTYVCVCVCVCVLWTGGARNQVGYSTDLL